MVQALIVLLGLSALLDVALGAWAGVAWRSFAGFWFPQNPSMAGDDPHLLGVVLTFFLLFVAVLQGMALAWVRKEKPQGFAIATAFGGYLVVSSLVTFVVFRRFEFLLVDGLRGALLVVTSMIGMNEPSTVRSLRLPARSERDERAPRDARPERGRHRRHERDGRRDSRPARGGREDRGGRGRRSGGSDSRGSDSRGSESRGGESRGDRSRPAPATAEAGRARPAEAEDESKRSLAVVVKGEFKTRPGGAEGDDGGDSDDRKRRRRRRRRGGVGEGAESGATSAPDSALPEDAVVSASGEEPRRRRGGQRRRGGRGRGESRGADDAANRSVDSSGASSGGGDLVGDAPRPPAPVRAAEVIRPSSESSAAESSSRRERAVRSDSQGDPVRAGGGSSVG
ncbi:MAG: hypothetical protein U0527_11690 [Candidatus Eisenbacteria bacterium]